jgi:hypothetical protein
MNMMSISGIGGTSMSPRAMMDKRIDSAAKAGTISATDETALESALDSIDSALGAGASSSTASTATSKLDPSGMKDRIDSLINDQVQSGALTQDQATTLQSLFAQGGPKPGDDSGSGDTDSLAMSGVSGTGQTGRMHHMHRPPPAPSDTDSTSTEGTDSSTSASDSTDLTKQIDSLISFLTTMRSQMASKNVYSSGSTATASSTASSTNSGLIIDALA